MGWSCIDVSIQIQSWLLRTISLQSTSCTSRTHEILENLDPSSAQLLTFSPSKSTITKLPDSSRSVEWPKCWPTAPTGPTTPPSPSVSRFDLNRTCLPKPRNLVYSSPTSVPYSLGRWKMVEAKGSTLAPFTTTEWPLGTLGVLMPLLPALNVRPLSLLRCKNRSPRARWLSSRDSLRPQGPHGSRVSTIYNVFQKSADLSRAETCHSD